MAGEVVAPDAGPDDVAGGGAVDAVEADVDAGAEGMVDDSTAGAIVVGVTVVDDGSATLLATPVAGALDGLSLELDEQLARAPSATLAAASAIHVCCRWPNRVSCPTNCMPEHCRCEAPGRTMGI